MGSAPDRVLNLPLTISLILMADVAVGLVLWASGVSKVLSAVVAVSGGPVVGVGLAKCLATKIKRTA